MKPKGIIILFFLLMAACQRQQQPVVAPWGETIAGEEAQGAVDEDFDLDDIERSGELIALTISGPETYYDYHGRALGTHAMLCQQLADSLGVRLRIEVCRDTAELVRRLAQGDGDLIAYPLTVADTLSPGWRVSAEKPMLAQALAKWYSYDKLEKARKDEQQLFTKARVKRRVFSPMLNREGGIISQYDGLFQQACQPIRWDWRLMAAQCYQESTFDPDALSWAGAKGLMQIMPSTADHLGLARDEITVPEKNISAAARLLAELERSFSDIPDRRERQNFILASYNGGALHIRDAMALAARDGRDPHRWDDVAEYVLRLSQPAYYQDPLVKHGYMRGSETVEYVRLVQQRYQQYRGVRTHAPTGSLPQKSRNERHRKKYEL